MSTSSVKYAIKDENVFSEISKWQHDKVVNQYKIKPLSVEVEITNLCNQQCPHCGMAANQINGRTLWSSDELYSLVDDLYNAGIPSISVTGGEPFLNFDRLCDCLSYCRNKIDICKLSSNGFWGNDPKFYFDKLVSCGLFDNRFFIPCLLLPIGEQKIPWEYIHNIINYVCMTFGENDIHIGITHIREYGNPSRLYQFVDAYENEYGDFPSDRVFVTEYRYINSHVMTNKAKASYHPVADFLVDDKRCFDSSVGRNVLPKLFVKCDGRCYPCVCFNVPEELCLGNYFEQGIENILEKFNNNKYVNLVRECGLAGFAKFLPDDVLTNMTASNGCEACERCIKYCESHNSI